MAQQWLRLGILAVSVTAAFHGAAAHTGADVLGGLASGFEHPLFGFDHLLAMLAVGIGCTDGRSHGVVAASYISHHHGSGRAGRDGGSAFTERRGWDRAIVTRVRPSDRVRMATV